MSASDSVGVRAGLGPRLGLVDLGLDLGTQRGVRLIGQRAGRAQAIAEEGDRIVLLERLDLGRVAIPTLVVVRGVAGQAYHARLDQGRPVAPPGGGVRRL